MSRFVRFEQFGGPEVLSVVNVEPPRPGPGQVRVQVRVAGLNPVDHKIFAGGPTAEKHGARLPSGVGNDFSGIVDQVGEGVTSLRPGDAVFGGARHRAQADFVVVDADRVLRKPERLTIEQAGALDISGRAAWATVQAVRVAADDTVLVSAAAGGVGLLACQLALATGATVIGTASLRNHDFLRSIGVVPVEYGEGLAERVRDASRGRVTAVLDYNGAETIDAGLALGVHGSRINTIVARGHASEHGIGGVGGQAASLDNLLELAELIAGGSIVLPIDSVFPIQRVAEAYTRLSLGHTRGKSILVTE
ncbi:NADP-dependent oxidoreductase [Glaciihabitans sp. dw_435]|uniref:NADP-dependent oxidoreductase n=1 Tax=Glaciihabitans sp. dw_435 TaxID=2720081 RepID=UPI001BD231B6|nr:NADP-dependent oxidoreductase [Glaciihabitans sp. dw_435]